MPPLKKRELMRIFERDLNTINMWLARGTIPKDVESAEVALLNAVNWFAAQRSGRIGISSDGEVMDLPAERAKLTRIQAEKAELEVAVMRGDLIPAVELEESLISLASSFTLRLRAVPVRAAAECGLAESDAERERIIRDALDEACIAFAKMASKVEGSTGDGAEGAAPAPEADRKRMGRQRKTAKPRKQRGARPVAD